MVRVYQGAVWLVAGRLVQMHPLNLLQPEAGWFSGDRRLLFGTVAIGSSVQWSKRVRGARYDRSTGWQTVVWVASTGQVQHCRHVHGLGTVHLIIVGREVGIGCFVL